MAEALDRHIGPAAGAHMRAPFGLGDEEALRGLVEEPHLVIAGGNSAEQARNALLGLLHVHATLLPLDST